LTTNASQNESPPPINEYNQAIYSLFMGDSYGKVVVIREDKSTDTFPQNDDEARDYISSNVSSISNEIE